MPRRRGEEQDVGSSEYAPNIDCARRFEQPCESLELHRCTPHLDAEMVGGDPLVIPRRKVPLRQARIGEEADDRREGAEEDRANVRHDAEWRDGPPGKSI